MRQVLLRRIPSAGLQSRAGRMNRRARRQTDLGDASLLFGGGSGRHGSDWQAEKDGTGRAGEEGGQEGAGEHKARVVVGRVRQAQDCASGREPGLILAVQSSSAPS